MSSTDGERRTGGSLWGCLGVGAAIFALGVVLIAGSGYLLLRGLFGAASGDGVSGAGDKIAHIDLEGLIASSDVDDLLFGGSGPSKVDRIKEQFRRALAEDTVKAIVLRINSPGGEITASDTIYNAVRKAAESKPVVVYMDSVAASGGYYVACGATEIVANETTLTGSIGVIMQSIGYEELIGKVGVTMRTFKSGEFKDMLSGSREVTDREAELIQNLITEMYDRFVGIVAEARDLPEATLRSEIADGRVFTGVTAQSVGLVDSTGYIEDAYERARKLGNAPKARVVRMRSSGGFLQAMGLRGAEDAAAVEQDAAVIPSRIEVDVSDRLLPRLKPGVPYLLPEFYLP